jgi:hypothetical protein
VTLDHIATAKTLDYILATVPLDHILATVTLDNIVAFDTIFAFFISLVVLLVSSPVTWCEEHLWNFSLLQRVRLSNSVVLMR